MGWIALLGPLIPVLVTQAEKLFGKGKGSDKLQAVLGAVTPILTQLTNAQQLGGPLPPQADIINEISAVAAKLYPKGTTYSSATDPLATVPAPITIPVQAPVQTAQMGSGLSDQQKFQIIKVLMSL